MRGLLLDVLCITVYKVSSQYFHPAGLLEYKQSYGRVADADIAEGVAETTLITHHYVWGIGWDF